MKSSLLNKLACPFDKQDLAIEIYKQEEDQIVEGMLTCQVCKRYYPIVHGIPIMSPDEYREQQLEQPILEKWGYLKGVSENNEPFRLPLTRQLEN